MYLKTTLLVQVTLSLAALSVHGLPTSKKEGLVSRAAAAVGSSCAGATLTPSVSAAPMWIQGITHNGLASFNSAPSTYTVYRNVKDFGAKGDGVTDDTAAINQAISSGGRCGDNCPNQSSTTQPAVVFFPAGKYKVSKPIIQYYFTQLVGDALAPPTLLASSDFSGMAVVDSDPYGSNGYNWFGNTNNFYRQVRNFVIDLTQTSATATTTGIHWQVAQATSLTNIVFQMSTASNTGHQGIWMENGSGGFMSDLVFNGGKFGMWVGSQQFTSRNLTFNSAQTAIYMNWNWAWTFKTININNCQKGIDMTAGGATNQGVGSILLQDATISNTPIGVLSDTSASSSPKASGSLLLDNVKLTNVPAVVKSDSGTTILAGTTGSSTIASWGQGTVYTTTGGSGTFQQGNLPSAPSKPSALLGTHGFFERPRPQYEQYAVSSFYNVKSAGAKGDGSTDDTAALQAAINNYAGCKIIFIPAGNYLVTSTITVPAGSRIVGEAWSTILAGGTTTWQSKTSLSPVFKVGNAGDSGTAELSDLVFSTKGPQPGAVLVEWNIRDPSGQQGAAGMWDVHFRVGGAVGTNLQSAQCAKGSSTASASCYGAGMLLHVTSSASAYLENVWAWTADHDLDGGSQLSIYTGRGILIESSQGPVWLYGTASEHNVLYQYQLSGASNVYMGMIQTETPYYQPAPLANVPYPVISSIADPTFSNCPAGSLTCAMAWGLRALNSNNVFVYGAGLYNFFSNYDQTCLTTESCQDAMADLENSNSHLYVYNLNTKAATNMVWSSANGVLAKQADNPNGFCQTINAFLVEAGTSSVPPSSTTTTTTTTSATKTTTTSSKTSTTTSASPSSSNGWTYLGCYVDALTPRTLPWGGATIPAGMTVEGCEADCAANSYIYAGVEYGNECWCGNTMPPTSAPASDCNMPCKGNAAETCGAGSRFNVYKSS
ncbi:pectate lyase superfamily protein-domain-containing protein [Umbelopsis sp. AD052]|nr:pectate lyase superfamily protein-domain-containing protein [Umbelopsis sp. AD052]